MTATAGVERNRTLALLRREPRLLRLLVGAAILVPIILAYTGYSYWVFRGKVGAEGYHAEPHT